MDRITKHRNYLGEPSASLLEWNQFVSYRWTNGQNRKQPNVNNRPVTDSDSQIEETIKKTYSYNFINLHTRPGSIILYVFLKNKWKVNPPEWDDAWQMFAEKEICTKWLFRLSKHNVLPTWINFQAIDKMSIIGYTWGWNPTEIQFVIP